MKQKINAFIMKNRDMTILAVLCVVGLLIGLIAGLIYNSQKKVAPPPPLDLATMEQEIVRDTGVFGDIEAHTSVDGEIVIGGDFVPIPMSLTQDPDTIWEQEQYTGGFTPTEKATLKDGSMGVLTIDKIGLSTNVYESPNNMQTLGKNVAHFPSTSAWDGNIALSAHNVNLDNTGGHFLNLHQLQTGDTIQYKTALGERTYQVTIAPLPELPDNKSFDIIERKGVKYMEKEKRGAPPKYDEAFKSGAVKMVTEGKRSIKEVAEQLGICRETRVSWLKKVGVSSSPRQENSQLKRLRELEIENKALKKVIVEKEETIDVLKKSVGIFLKP